MNVFWQRMCAELQHLSFREDIKSISFDGEGSSIKVPRMDGLGSVLRGGNTNYHKVIKHHHRSHSLSLSHSLAL